MAVLVPALILITGFLVVMVLLYRNILQLDKEAAQLWIHAQATRLLQLDAVEKLYATLLLNSNLDKHKHDDLASQVQTCRRADDPTSAAAGDTQLFALLRELAKEANMQQLAASPSAKKSIDSLLKVEEEMRECELRYNNAATRYNNAGVTFPALLIAKRADWAPRALYQAEHFRRKDISTNKADQESLAEKSPHIMNAYMLWAVGMSDATLEEADR